MSRNQIVHTPDEIARIRRAAAITAQVRDQIASAIHPGMTTLDVDMLAGEFIRASGGKSAFLNYHKGIEEFYAQFGDRLPKELKEELAKLKAKLN